MTKRNSPIETPEPTPGNSNGVGLFPHYTRLFSAIRFASVYKHSGKLLLWTALIAGIGVNIAALHRNPEGIPAWTAIFSRTTDVLGVTDATTAEIGSNIKTNEAEYSYWTEVINAHPDYRDAHVNAAVLAYELGLMDEARSHLDKIKKLDPNYTKIAQLENLLRKN